MAVGLLRTRARSLLECVAEHREGGVQPLLASAVGLVVGFSRHVADQLVEVLVIGASTSTTNWVPVLQPGRTMIDGPVWRIDLLAACGS